MKTLKVKQTVTAEVSESDIIDAAIELVESRFKIQDCWISADQKEVRSDDEYRHGSPTDHLVRLATDKDVAAFIAVSVLKKSK